MRIVFKKGIFNSIKLHDDVSLAVSFGRIINALIMHVRVFEENHSKNADDLIANDKIIHALILGIAVLFEGIKFVNKKKEILETLPCYSKHQAGIQKVLDIVNSHYYKTVMVPIRNKFVFHYDSAIDRELLSNESFDDPVVFMESPTGKRIDTVYVFSDLLFIDHIVREYGWSGDKWEGFEKICSEFMDLNKLFLVTADSLIPDLTRDYCIFEDEEVKIAG